MMSHFKEYLQIILNSSQTEKDFPVIQFDLNLNENIASFKNIILINYCNIMMQDAISCSFSSFLGHN